MSFILVLFLLTIRLLKLCIAHFCDTHGPTPLMVTECLPVGCSSCSQDDGFRNPQSVIGLPSLNLVEVAGVAHATTVEKSAALANENSPIPNPRVAKNTLATTPPESPRNDNDHKSRTYRDSSFRRTYDDIVKKKASPCDNCALTLPRQTDLSVSPLKLENNSPILRTRKPYKRVVTSTPVDQLSPPNSHYSVEKPECSDAFSHEDHKFQSLSHAGKSSENFAHTSANLLHHHYLDYISTHEPLIPKSFSNVRQSCLRTLSCESLPPSTNQPISANKSSNIGDRKFTSSGSSPSSSGGPIFFGDPLAGYTTAYTFRIPDPNVRGRHRVYALIALTSHHESAAIQTFTYLSAVFRETAQWILTLAELELKKTERSRQENQEDVLGSSFLIGYRGSHDGSNKLILKNRGLAEIVGMPDFFIELHARFVRYLAELHIILRS